MNSLNCAFFVVKFNLSLHCLNSLYCSCVIRISNLLLLLFGFVHTKGEGLLGGSVTMRSQVWRNLVRPAVAAFSHPFRILRSFSTGSFVVSVD